MSADVESKFEPRGDLPPHVVDGLPMPVVLTRRSDDSVVRVNREYTAAYGLNDEDAAGRPFRELHWVPEDRDQALELQANGNLESIEVRIRAADGECHWAEADVSLFEYEGQPVLMTTLYDVGRRKEAEQELEAAAAGIHEMARFPEMNPGPVARLALNGTVLGANAAANAIFGLESLEDECLWNLLPELDESVRTRVLEDGAPVRQDVHIGDTWLALTLAYEEGSQQIFVYGSNITARKEAERELSEGARFPEMNPGPVARLHSDGTVHRANLAARRVLGREDIHGMSFREFFGIPDDVWDRVLTSGEPIHYEAEIGPVWLSFTLVHEPESDQVFAYGSDVTELKAAEGALTELARFPDMNPGPVLRLDQAGTVVLANPAALRLFGTNDLTGRSWLEICPGVDEMFWDVVREASEPVACEAQLGERHFMLHHARGPEGIFIFVFGSDLTDLKSAESVLRQSEKMATLGTLTAGMAHELNNPAAAAQRASEHLEIALGELQEAQLALRALKQGPDMAQLLIDLNDQARRLAASPAEVGALERLDHEAELEGWLDDHGVDEPWEFATALVDMGHTVTGLDELRSRGAGDHVSLIVAWHVQAYRVYRLAEEIRHGSGRLVEIVGAMKAYAYLGQAPLQDVEVNEGLKNTLIILENKLKEGITVTRDFDPELPVIEAYGSELNQVWTNLLDNAAGAMGGEGHITIKTRTEDERVVVEIEDDGPGIPTEIQTRIFDAFFTTKPPGEGSGLGLNTSYNVVVKKHGGTIDVDSVPGRTCFTVRLPFTALPEKTQSATPA
jgi:PAS domain S-box-containing protein